ncbi:MAG: ABC transporter permease [Candidatus Scatomorpha sp.]
MKKRLFHYVIILLVVIAVNFFIPRALPGSPIRSLVADEDIVEMTAEKKMGILEAYHLTDPLYKQFGYYIRDLFTLNWGTSFSKRLPIAQLMRSAAKWTLLLSGITMILSVFTGSLIGAYSALHRKKGRDLGMVLGTTFISSIPSFWIAILLLAVFSAKLGWFPAYGAYSMWSKAEGFAKVLDVAWHMVLPVIALVITSLMPYFTTSRYSVLKTISSDYVRMARFRGIPEKKINVGYIMRNALVPVFTMLMMDIGYLLSGSVLVETVFSFPGLGVLMRDAVSARDYPLIQYTFLVSSVLTIAALFAADVLYHKIDPSLEESYEK